MQALINFLRSIYNVITGFPSFLISVVKQIFCTLWDVLKDAIVYIFEKFFELAVYAIGLIPIPVDISPGAFLLGLPAEFLNIIGLIRLPEAMAIILSALLIRFVLQLIPFTRLGS